MYPRIFNNGPYSNNLNHFFWLSYYYIHYKKLYRTVLKDYHQNTFYFKYTCTISKLFVRSLLDSFYNINLINIVTTEYYFEWCIECHLLNYNFNNSDISSILEVIVILFEVFIWLAVNHNFDYFWAFLFLKVQNLVSLIISNISLILSIHHIIIFLS
jgi:hypothetical protein